MDIYINPNNKNDTNEDNLVRVFKDSALEESIRDIIQNEIETKPGKNFAVIQMDMDKSVEIRKLGISYKLAVLEEINNKLHEFVGERCRIYPHGTRDDLTIIHNPIEDGESTEKLTASILAFIEHTTFGCSVDKGPFHVTYSAGIARYPETAEDAVSLLELADGAVRVAKDDGKNRYALAENGYNYILHGMISRQCAERLWNLSKRTKTAPEVLLREGLEELFQKHSALYRFCCQVENDD